MFLPLGLNSSMVVGFWLLLWFYHSHDSNNFLHKWTLAQVLFCEQMVYFRGNGPLLLLKPSPLWFGSYLRVLLMNRMLDSNHMRSLTVDEKSWGFANTTIPPNNVTILTTKTMSFKKSIWVSMINKGSKKFLTFGPKNFLKWNNGLMICFTIWHFTVAAQGLKYWWGSRGVHFLGWILLHIWAIWRNDPY